VDALRQIETWPARWTAAGVVRADGVRATAGDAAAVSEWASVTKLATALAVLVAAEEGVLDLDEPAGPPGASVRHLLAHASGLPLHGETSIAQPESRRIYSNEGFVVLARHLADRAEMPFPEYLHAAAQLGAELLAPTLVAPETLAEARTVQFQGLTGVLPGFGRQERNDWGLGFELKDGKEPHWTGTRNSAETFGHFGRTGTFLWVDPGAGLALGVLTDLDFDAWAQEAWPRLADAVLAEAQES